MYLEFYGLKEMPFGLTPDPRYIFKTESHLEMLATVRYSIEHNKGLVVVTGEVGTGKTTTLRAALEQFTEEVLYLKGSDPFACIKGLSNNLLAIVSMTFQLKGDCGARASACAANCNPFLVLEARDE